MASLVPTHAVVQYIESVRQGVAALCGEHVCRPEHDALARRVATLEEDAHRKHIP